MGEIIITGKHYPFFGVKDNTHNVYKFIAKKLGKWFGLLYCANKWNYKEARVDFEKKAEVAFGSLV